MSNKQIDLMQHEKCVRDAGKHAWVAFNTASMFIESESVKQLRMWPEDYDAICKALRESGHRSDGFYVGTIKIIRHNERG
jgi:hypothetical protein